MKAETKQARLLLGLFKQALANSTKKCKCCFWEEGDQRRRIGDFHAEKDPRSINSLISREAVGTLARAPRPLWLPWPGASLNFQPGPCLTRPWLQSTGPPARPPLPWSRTRPPGGLLSPPAGRALGPDTAPQARGPAAPWCPQRLMCKQHDLAPAISTSPPAYSPPRH